MFIPKSIKVVELKENTLVLNNVYNLKYRIIEESDREVINSLINKGSKYFPLLYLTKNCILESINGEELSKEDFFTFLMECKNVSLKKESVSESESLKPLTNINKLELLEGDNSIYFGKEGNLYKECDGTQVGDIAPKEDYVDLVDPEALMEPNKEQISKKKLNIKRKPKTSLKESEMAPSKAFEILFNNSEEDLSNLGLRKYSGVLLKDDRGYLIGKTEDIVSHVLVSIDYLEKHPSFEEDSINKEITKYLNRIKEKLESLEDKEVVMSYNMELDRIEKPNLNKFIRELDKEDIFESFI